MKVDFNANIPIYIQIIRKIKTKIIAGELKAGDKLPSVRDMASKFQVNPNTLQRVYQELEREGITYTQRGTGTFVKEDLFMVDRLKKETAHKIIEDFLSGMKSLGFNNEEIINLISEEVKKEEK